jgi:hypothetical protein
LVEWGIDYGDGHQYVTHDQASADRDAYWHVYNSPGTFTVRAWVKNAAGQTGSGTCTFAWASTSGGTPVPGDSGVRVGAVCSDGWQSSATGSGACSHHGGVAYWLYG